LKSADEHDVTEPALNLSRSWSPTDPNAARALEILGHLALPIYALTLFCSSALLFLMEPMFAKMVLPLLGGTPAVWNTCMVCFQGLLLAGYAYGHWSIRWLGIKRQIGLQLMTLVSAVVALPIALPQTWSPPTTGSPAFWLTMLVLVVVGLPFFAVSTTGPVIQRWFAATRHRAGGDPYFLYAASNVGSMAALIGYPVLVEPFITLQTQSRLWGWGYGCLIALTGISALCVQPNRPGQVQPIPDRIALPRRLRWVALSFVPSSLLLGVTTFITTDIASVPLFWVIPLALYLLSFILVFSSRPPLSHRLMCRLLPVVVLGVTLFMVVRIAQPVAMVLAVHLAALFVISMVCHGELAADRPASGSLTDFYLMMSVGGVLGGLFNGLLAPVIFQSAAEYPLMLVVACLVARWRAETKTHGIPLDFDEFSRVAVLRSRRLLRFSKYADRTAKPQAAFRCSLNSISLDLAWPLIVALLAWTLLRWIPSSAVQLRLLALGLVVIFAALAMRRRWRFAGSVAALLLFANAACGHGTLLETRRSFFGIHRIVQNTGAGTIDLYHGTTVHGRQFIIDDSPIRATDALTYYHRTGPIGQLLSDPGLIGNPHHIDVVGLGVGSLAAYAKSTSHLTYFEIDPAVRWVADESGYFSFLQCARQRGADVQIVLGDARLTLQHTADGSADLLVLDAFSGDAIPVHLLTRQAMQLYLSKLAPHGVLAIHVSNLYLDLLPVCSALAADAHCAALHRDDLELAASDVADGKCASQWVLIAPDPQSLGRVADDPRWTLLPPADPKLVWTDDFSNVLSVFRWH
jgi:hypothetical protein